ncbi:MAG: hypothetical protein ACXV8M_15865 [Candidatus Angelobacter sp.]
MSSAVVSTSAALGRPFVFDTEAVPEVSLPLESGEGHLQSRPPQRVRPADLASADPRLAHITPASRLDIRPAPEMVSSGVPAIDALTGGLPRGCLTEICGPASSGRTTLLLSALAAAARRGEFCVVVDASDALDPHSAAAASVDLDRLLWVRCGDDPPPKSCNKQGCPISRTSLAREMGHSSQVAFDFDRTRSRQSWHCLEQALRATDLLLESGGFGLIVLDLGDMPQQAARRIPLTTWFRFRRAIEHTPTILLAIEQHAIAGSCSSLLLQLGSANEPATEGQKKICVGEQSTIDFQIAGPTHAQLLTGLDITADIRSRLEHKPARSVMFASKTAWAG